MKELLPDDDRPDLATGVYVERDEVAVIRTGVSKTKVHRPDPDASDGEPLPKCRNGRVHSDDNPSYKFMAVGDADAFRDPCAVCFPAHYTESVPESSFDARSHRSGRTKETNES